MQGNSLSAMSALMQRGKLFPFLGLRIKCFNFIMRFHMRITFSADNQDFIPKTTVVFPARLVGILLDASSV